MAESTTYTKPIEKNGKVFNHEVWQMTHFWPACTLQTCNVKGDITTNVLDCYNNKWQMYCKCQMYGGLLNRVRLKATYKIKSSKPVSRK